MSASHALHAPSEVISAEPIGVLRSTSLTQPNDPLLSQQYAWDQLGMSNVLASQSDVSSVGVVVMESGVLYSHPDLQGAFSAARLNATVRTNVVDDPPVCGGHGTNVAGVLGAVTNNNVGVAGYSGYRVRIFTSESSMWLRVIHCFRRWP